MNSGNNSLHNSLDLKQKQRLNLNQHIYQSLQVLAMPSWELQQYMQEQAEQNPVIEIDLLSDHSHLPEENFALNYDEVTLGENWQQIIHAHKEDANYYPNFNQNRDNQGLIPDMVAHNQRYLPSYLRMQLSFSQAMPSLIEIAELICEYLDHDGYLSLSNQQLATICNCEESTVEQAVNLIQSLEPAGIAARNLSECLISQIDLNNPQRPLLIEIIQYHLSDLAAKRFKPLAAKLKISLEQLSDLTAIISELNPYPSRSIEADSTHNHYIIPDIIISQSGDDYQVSLSKKSDPHLQISAYYRNLDPLILEDQAVKDYIQQKLQQGLNLIQNIEKRQETILQLAKITIAKQRAFFEGGHLEPFTMKEMAQLANIHESTVSRAVAGKYIQTRQGVFEWKYFFPRAFEQNNGAVIPDQIKEHISRLIKDENKQKPLSDQKLSEMLDGFGYQVARRTVAKYRDELQIPTKDKRKQAT